MECCVYTAWADDDLLYVGVTKNPPKRFREHGSQSLWRHQVTCFRVETWHPDRASAHRIRRELILRYRPTGNSYYPFGRRRAESLLAG